MEEKGRKSVVADRNMESLTRSTISWTISNGYVLDGLQVTGQRDTSALLAYDRAASFIGIRIRAAD